MESFSCSCFLSLTEREEVTLTSNWTNELVKTESSEIEFIAIVLELLSGTVGTRASEALPLNVSLNNYRLLFDTLLAEYMPLLIT